MKKTIRIPLVFIILLIASVTIICVKSNASTTGVITEVTVNVRKEASVDSDVVMFVTQDDKVEVIEKTGEWYKIKYNKKEGYVYSDFVKVDSEKISQSTTTEQEKLQSEDDEVTKTITPSLILSKDTVVKIAPSIMSDVIYTTTEETTINVNEQINGWSYITVNNINGWVRTEDIKEADNKETTEEENKTENEDQKEENKTAYIKYDSVNLRKEPSADSTILQKLKLNEEVSIIEEVDSIWCKVSIDGATGYISKELLSDTKQEEKKEETTNTTSRDGESVTRENVKEETKENNSKSETSNNKTSTSKTNEIVEYAMKYLGCDYVYGGSSPKGFDCSGFTSYVYKKFGYNLSRSSGGQANDGTKVNKADLQPGDLVIYKNQSLTKIGHVGIYIGNNKMIHASEPGVGVTITDIDSKAHKYPQRFVMGRRIVK